MEQLPHGRRRLHSGDERLDAGYRAVQAALACTTQAHDEQLGKSFVELVDQLEQQFLHEEAMMETIDFPALHTHREQHARVLSALRLAEASLDAEPWLARHALSLLADWLELHAQTQDTVLALALELASAPPGKVS